MFNITYYRAFQNSRNILQELYLLLAPDKEPTKVFPDVPLMRFHGGKNVKDYLVRPALTDTNGTERCRACGGGDQVFN